MPEKRTLIILAAALLLTVGLGAAWVRVSNKDKPKVSFTESSLKTLETKLQGLDVEDLGGLSVVQFSTQDLDQLGSKIDGLAFDDLGGLSSP